MKNHSIKIIPLGGLGSIGKNMLAVESPEGIVIIDAGVLFPKEELPGIDLVIPDYTYILKRRHKVKAILITHGHEDHIGALPYLLRDFDVPVYAPRFAHGLIKAKLKEHRPLRHRQIEEISPGQTYVFGEFSAEWFRVCHSIPDAMGIALRTPLGLLVHTGDFKIDHTPVDGHTIDFGRLAQLADEGVLVLFSDSTYAELPGYTPSEQVVGEALDQIIRTAPGRVMIATFASLISRIQQVIDSAIACDRKIAVTGRSMVDNVNMSIKMGYLKRTEDVLLPLSELKRQPPDRTIIITTGSQGEPTSALIRISTRKHQEIHIATGDTVVISASPIPGNEVAVATAIDNLSRQGARVIYSRLAPVHVHGHASQEELKMILSLLCPRYFVPVHGEYRHLVAHAEIAQNQEIPPDNVFVLEDGDVLEVTRNNARVTERIPLTPKYVDGLRVWDVQSSVLRDRNLLARNGIVVVVLPVDQETGRLTEEPRLISSGVVEIEGTEDFHQKVANSITESLSQSSTELESLARMDNKVRELVRQSVIRETGRSPIIIPVQIES